MLSVYSVQDGANVLSKFFFGFPSFIIFSAPYL
jgi:hypothetical protein